MKFRLRRNLPAGIPDPGSDPNDHTPDEADDLFAPEFNVSGHGFTGLEVARFVGPVAVPHVLAQANTLANSKRLVIIVHVRDVDNYSALHIGHGTWLDSNYATGHAKGGADAPMFLDWITPGAITNVELDDPLVGWIIPLGDVIDVNNLWLELGAREQP